MYDEHNPQERDLPCPCELLGENESRL